MNPTPEPDLEDELGDVLEKAARHAAFNYEHVAAASGVPVSRIQDAIDYRSELTQAELGRLARALNLNEVGLNALACGCYPRARMCSLPFELWPIRMPFGVGVVNAYLVTTGGDSAVLFDTGASHAELHRAWPERIQRLEAVCVTHYEAEHVGGLEVVLRESEVGKFYGPPSGRWPQCVGLGEGKVVEVGGLRITALQTPGHAAEHNCYHVTLPGGAAPGLLISGDLIFAGSLGGGYFCCQRQLKHSRRILEMLPPETIIAPGHGPLTSVENERKFNPFMV